jgi:hypothetical protein
MAGQAFQTNVDICNRALQRCGARRITTFSDPTKNAKEVSFCYDKLRRAELRRNLWRFSIRRVMLRPLGTALQAWNPLLTYASGAYVSYGTLNYVSLQNANTNQEPDTAGTYWAVFTGNTSLLVTFSAYAGGTAYTQGQVVAGSDGRLYQLNVATSTGNDPTATTGFWVEYFGNITAPQYDSTQGYGIGELVFYTINNHIYSSNTNGNTNDPTTSNSGWVQQSCTSVPIVIPWPAGTGPSTQPETKNVFYMPSGYMRVAPQAPDAGRTSVLGFPSNIPATDWTFEGNLLVSIMSGAIMFRFAADVIDVTTMDDMFCEGLAARIALEVCEPLTQSGAKLKDIASEYKQFMGDARNVNGIEQGSVEPPLDDYIQSRF